LTTPIDRREAVGRDRRAAALRLAVEETYEVLSNLARLAADAPSSDRKLWFYWSL
jgi:hypothetical protein